MDLRSFFLLIFLAFFMGWVPEGQALKLSSKQAILIDLTTGTVLFEKNPDERTPPSSMTKLMTYYLVFEEIKAGRLSLSDTFKVSKKAWKKRGSRMFLEVNSHVSIDDLLHGAIIQSGNDACITLAEGISGSEDVFVDQMNARAQEWGAESTTFRNASGWPHEEHLSTVRDLALIGTKILEDFSDYLYIFKKKEFTYNNIRQPNSNPLLYSNFKSDGLKTGNTDKGGSGVVGTAVEGERRLLLAINGAKNYKKRAQDAKALMGWGFKNFASPLLFRANEEVDRADIWLGKSSDVPLFVDNKGRDVFVTLPRRELRNLKIEAVYTNPLEAPVKKGQQVGKLVITAKTIDPVEVPLVAGEDVERVGPFSRVTSMIYYLFMGHN